MSSETDGLSHIREDGSAAMVDVSEKTISTREALASGLVLMNKQTLEAIFEGELPKGDVLAVARIAGIQGAKKTADLIPLCHPLPLSKVKLRVTPDSKLPGLRVSAETVTRGVTGVEMEALTAVSVACLTIYDMLKALDKAMEITDIRLLEKQGGKSGDWAHLQNKLS